MEKDPDGPEGGTRRAGAGRGRVPVGQKRLAGAAEPPGGQTTSVWGWIKEAKRICIVFP
jgi:hypothetical protein